MDKILLLLLIPGFGRSRVKQFIYDNPLLLEDDDYFNYMISKSLDLPISIYRDSVDRLKDKCKKLGVEIRVCKKKSIIDTPLILYLKGDSHLLDSRKLLGVVGTRTPRVKSQIIGEELVAYSVKQGWVTVSGLAKGCDTLAHRVTVKNEGATIAVLPMGYRKSLAPWILDKGLFVSEYPPGEDVRKYKCVNRNRIITGLSKGLYVIESGKGGGSEHSIKYAKKGGIPISYSFGFNGIEEYGAVKVTQKDEFDLFLSENYRDDINPYRVYY
ncbi:MAG: hypothetical protein B6229_04450 [Spirochaetaceae bacterium 4572_7]|nr:MAG: hypothetical protein B6229_04450 [Spirochaetaceae bacterium 4572_7]